MGKKSERHHTESSQRRRIIYFASASVASGGLFVVGLIRNGNGAVERYNALIAVDKAGGDVEAALLELRSFIYAHMNTEIGGENGVYPPIQLKETYNRLVTAEQARVEAANKDLIVRAKEYCEGANPQQFSGRYRVDCVGAYVDENGAKPKEIESSLYQYDFVAPRWSKDLAGFSMIAFGIFVLCTLFSLFVYWRTKHAVHIAN